MTPLDSINLEIVDTLQIEPSRPFDFRLTFWKPSHFHTGLERHSVTRSWRTFRVDGLFAGITAYMTQGGLLQLDIYSSNDWTSRHSDMLRSRVVHAYGLHEDLAPFVALASETSEMRRPLELFGGMRQSCPENLFEIAVISLLLQNATIARTTQMMNNLLIHYGRIVSFDNVTLRAFFTPREIIHATEGELRESDRLGYRAKYMGRFAEFFLENDPDALATTDKNSLVTRFQSIKGVGPYTAAIIAGHAIRDHSALGLDVWNRKILARKVLGLDDSDPDTVRQEMSRIFPGWEGLAGLYLVEEEYLSSPVTQLVDGPAA